MITPNSKENQPMLEPKDIYAILSEWNLSATTLSTLVKEPEIVADLIQSRHLPPLPPGYVPTVVEVLFDDLVYLRSVNGQVIYSRQCEAEYQPPFVEYRFDGETAVFQVGGEYVVNRTEGIAELVALQGLMH
jgi:hypothetical protein